jgi:putative ABC transport system permease protein
MITAQVALPYFRYNTAEKQMDFYLDVEKAVRRLPGIRGVEITDSVPPGGWQTGIRYSELVTENRPHPAPGLSGIARTRQVTPDYFQALDIPILQGRGLPFSVQHPSN